MPHRPQPTRLATVLLLLLPILATGPALGADVEVDGWGMAQAPHFTVYADGGTGVAREAALRLEALRGFLVEIAPSGRFDAELPIQVHLFTDPADLRLFQPDMGVGTAGFIVSRDDGVTGATVWPRSGERPGRFLVKQYIAWVLAENLPELPAWFRGGLTDYYGSFRIVDGEAQLGRIEADDLSWLRGHGHLITEVGAETAGGDPAAEDAEAESRRRALWWAMVHKLVVGEEGMRTRVPAYLRRLAAGEEPDAAFAGAFGMTVAELEASIPEYVQRDRFRFVRVPLAEVAHPDVEVTPMHTAEVEQRLGDLELRSHLRPGPSVLAAAEARYRRTLAAGAEEGGGPPVSTESRALARAGLAGIAALRGDTAAAIDGYRAAAEALPADYRLQYRLGDTLLSTLEGRRPTGPAGQEALAEAVAALRRSTELEPDFPTAWQRLGFALNLSAEASDEAVAALERALDLEPRRVDVVSNLLLARARVGDRGGVAEAMQRLRDLGADAANLARGREMELRLLLRHGENLARAERLDDAVAAFAQVRAESSDPALREAADRQIQLIATVTQRNLYAQRYQAAAEKISAGEPDAGAAVAELRAMAKPGLQTEAADALAARLEERGDTR